ncbi:MAG: hypothetical protein M0C28_33400 [Candidatus Moduliflexus flocculans]|nr:hypothetical protein [Candidatus Moduliflexus flocculans]
MLINPSEKVVYSAGNGEVEIYEVRIPEEWHGRTSGRVAGELKRVPPRSL